MPREPQNWDPAAVWRDRRYRNSGQRTDDDTGTTFTPKQHYYVGGNTKVYGAILFRMRERDFGAVQHVEGTSPDWPLSYVDFEPWYTEASSSTGCTGSAASTPTTRPPTSRIRTGPSATNPGSRS
jgi:choline dehydrogenase-like flavoprotein